jgi:uncharacterized OB-fold protein
MSAPVVDRDSRPWWEALARHEFVLQRCEGCATWRWPARAMCNACGSFDWSWQQPSGQATVAGWIVTRHAFLPGFEAPYVVLSARLAEQPDIVIPGGYDGPTDGAGLRIGAGLTVGFHDVHAEGGSYTLLCWRRTESAGGGR